MHIILKNCIIVLCAIIFVSCSVNSTTQLDQNKLNENKVSKVTIEGSSKIGIEFNE